MKAQTSAYLDKSRELLDEADAILRIDLYEAAGRTAYLAGFHAAQALISERTGQIAKSHSGVRSTFARLVKDDPQVNRALVRFLGRAYRFKEIADYGTGPQAVVTVSEAQEAIGAAGQFVDCIASLLS